MGIFDSLLKKFVPILFGLAGYFLLYMGGLWIHAMIIGELQGIGIIPGPNNALAYRGSIGDTYNVIFYLSGSVATLIIGYAFFALTPKFTSFKSSYLRMIAYSLTIWLLLFEPLPLYLSIYRPTLVGSSGMMNLAILLPGLYIIYGLIAVVNVFIILRFIRPQYRRAHLTSA